jgi:hypothetical protein
MVRKFVLAAALAALAGAATAQIVPVTPGGGGTPPAADPAGGGIIPGRPPGPAPGSETENDKAFKALLVGSWRLDLVAPQGWTAWVESTYNADGTFSGSQVSISPNPAPYNRSEVKFFGTYTVKALDRSNFTLSATYTTPANIPPGSETLTYIDQNTLYNVKAGKNATRIP